MKTKAPSNTFKPEQTKPTPSLPVKVFKKDNPKIVNREYLKIEKSYDFFTKGPKVANEVSNVSILSRSSMKIDKEKCYFDKEMVRKINDSPN